MAPQFWPIKAKLGWCLQRGSRVSCVACEWSCRNICGHPTPTKAIEWVVVVVAGNREAVTLGGLSPDTQYQLTVAAVWNGKKYRSRPIVFRTLEPPRTSFQQDSGALAGNSGPPISPHADTAPSLSGFGIFSDEFGNISTNSTSRNELPTIRGVEIGIVVLVLIVWAGAIALFFNRWGKIRMLLPYQPDYKQEQLKVPGTGVCANGTCNGQHSHQFNQLHYFSRELFRLSTTTVFNIYKKTERNNILQNSSFCDGLLSSSFSSYCNCFLFHTTSENHIL
ncbi:conserved hypothetical protein [Culex quinquefasciatus]|uniref:Fibronectin type III domain-containing protein n=1 Tax=Culex quinquefasciatus TaxID=7176 RepID=B0XAM7_CULQU|nr:conserved hypothetical protein [Culex quinquefasciatus]|eukprot:XP_001866699.1 conserved hypothetical protein [Culex quinquefasciatus]